MANIHFQKKLIHVCDIQRPAYTQSATGEPIATWSTVGSAVPCRYVEKQEAIANEGRGFMMAEKPILLLNSGVDVNEEDRIINIKWASDSTTVDSGPFTIEADLDRRTSIAHHISLRLERIE